MKDLFKRMLRASIGLILFSFGVYLTVQANVGLAPWDAFSMGLSLHLPIAFGTAAMLVSALILTIDILMREHIGVGTVLDAFLVGASLNVFEKMNLVPKQTNPVIGVIMMIAGLTIMCFCQYLYMTAGLCCGPRDTLLVGLGKRVRKIPIGIVNIGIMACVLLVGFLLGAPVGLGTVISAFGTGLIMQLVFRLLNFEPRNIVHTGFSELLSRYHVKA